MTKDEAGRMVFDALDRSGVSYDQHGQGARIRSLMELPVKSVESVEVVRGGYRGTVKPRSVLGYTNSSRHGKRVYTLVANLNP